MIGSRTKATELINSSPRHWDTQHLQTTDRQQQDCLLHFLVPSCISEAFQKLKQLGLWLLVRLEYRFYEFLGQRTCYELIMGRLVRPYVITPKSENEFWSNLKKDSFQKDLSRVIDLVSVYCKPITAAAGSEPSTVLALSNVGVVVSNPTRAMDVCVSVYSIWLL
jgi:hypothetical protein